MLNKLPSKIAIIGVGLIGGSIAMGLKKRLGNKISISGLCNDHKRAQSAQDRGMIDHIISADLNIPENTQLVIIGTHISTTIKILDKLMNIPLKCPVIDVGSTKLLIQKHIQTTLKNKLNFIGTHPMAGSEINGFENADPFLFHSKPWIICPNKNTKPDDIKMIKNLVTELGSIPVIMDAKKHDEIAAWSSHIFLAISSILIGTCTKKGNWDRISEMASSGFRDVTRLGSHDPAMITDIFSTNKLNILNSLRKLTQEINLFSRILEKDDSKDLINYLTHSKTIRDTWLSRRFN